MESKVFRSVFALIIISLAAVVCLSACAKDEKDARDPFIGSFRVNYEYVVGSQKYSGTYTLTIVASATNVNDIILNNIDNSNESVRATVNGNAMTIPQQTIMNYGISGSGTLNGNVLNFSTMETQTGGSQINIIQIGTKQ